MTKPITQRELRNQSGEIMRGLDRGESYLVTRNGVPVGELVPVQRRRFVGIDAVLDAFEGAPAIDRERFRSDVDQRLDQGIAPRA
jgi:prevent-host-death family protein